MPACWTALRVIMSRGTERKFAVCGVGEPQMVLTRKVRSFVSSQERIHEMANEQGSVICVRHGLCFWSGLGFGHQGGRLGDQYLVGRLRTQSVLKHTPDGADPTDASP